MNFHDIIYKKEKGIATIAINRPEVMNAFRAETIHEMISAFEDAWIDREIGVVVVTGTGEKAFCTGGDQKSKDMGGYSGTSRSDIGLDVEDLHMIIRRIPKPVIAAVNGYAIGGGHVIHVVCDLTIASEKAIFGQVGPKFGSVDPGFGTAYLARVVGEKKAREIWYLCKQYTATEAEKMGLVNKVVPHEKLLEETYQWCEEILDKSPTALKVAKYSINADSSNIEGISQLGMSALALYYDTLESKEGYESFLQKRPANFRKFRKRKN
ncbi:1,4-dihydroxy-2-naphthoyl-CoA synthase [Brevibacillus fluminis]|uniref:1,4-dihydroxy-2-naphthoyl-CoA synthase n=1 Tax=Brevibacillus fluminis TaxID=511487 RepID=A0A3M8DHR0_9BACL|nr:enoyl-CoA hydratase-related protein [Brevibacillus fluminis]RNB87642.1 1,4-dihydroxy-2-naphthoyl-CoA synthase [Brevibacillus fluminis]